MIVKKGAGTARAVSADRKAMSGRISANERDRIVDMLRSEPLPVVHRKTGRSWLTLARIARDCA